MFLGKLKPLEDMDNWNIFVKQTDVNKPLISPQIRKALFLFLHSSNKNIKHENEFSIQSKLILNQGVKPFTIDFISPKVLDNALRHPDFIRERLNLNESTTNIYLYKYGEEADFFLIILNGSAIMEIGKEKINVNAGMFSYYGTNALMTEPNQGPEEVLLNETNFKPYIPEFSLKIEQYCVYFQISRGDWLKLVKNTNLERKK